MTFLLIWPENCSIVVGPGVQYPPGTRLFGTRLTLARAAGGRPSPRFDAMPPKILVVEDNWDFREILISILHAIGYEVIEAVAAPEGIEKALAESPNLIIMDLGLPGMDGIAVLAEKGKSLKGKSVVYVLTNIGDEKKLCEARELGAKECLVKANISLSDLVEKVKKEVGMSI